MQVYISNTKIRAVHSNKIRNDYFLFGQWTLSVFHNQ